MMMMPCALRSWSCSCSSIFQLNIPNICILLLILHSAAAAAHTVRITVSNECPFPIWPATAPNKPHPVIGGGGFYLPSGQSCHISAPWDWSGRIWARTHCTFFSSEFDVDVVTTDINITNTSSTTSSSLIGCLTGDCGGRLACDGLIGTPPVTLVEITLRTDKAQPSFYDVSLVDGYNLPVHVTAPNCSSIRGCLRDLKATCPEELQVVVLDPSTSGVGGGGGEVVACKSACLAFDSDRFCCRGPYYGRPERCGPTLYSDWFKKACPCYVSYAFDQSGGAVMTCMVNEELKLTFCPNSRLGDGGAGLGTSFY